MRTACRRRCSKSPQGTIYRFLVRATPNGNTFILDDTGSLKHGKHFLRAKPEGRLSILRGVLQVSGTAIFGRGQIGWKSKDIIFHCIVLV